MPDIITRLRQDELVIAKLIMKEVRPLFDWVRDQPDDGLRSESLLAETERLVLLAVRAGLEWRASMAYRYIDFGPARLEKPTALELVKLSLNHLGSASLNRRRLVAHTLKWLRWRASDTRLPPLSTALGQFRDGQFFPDETAIREWAAFYDWSK